VATQADHFEMYLHSFYVLPEIFNQTESWFGF